MSKTLSTLEEKFKYLEELGFETPEHRLIEIKDIPVIYEEFKERRKKNDYCIDGIVFSVNNVSKMKSYGVLNERQKPKGQIALKFPPEKHFSKILGGIFSFHGTQMVSMVAKIEPVEIDNTIVKKASLKSYRWVLENKVGIGSVVEIVKSGDIIPKIERAVTEGQESFEYPERCPYCDSFIEVGEAQLYCINEFCPAKVAARVSRFLKVLKVKGLAWQSLLKYAEIGIELKHFVRKEWNQIEEKIKFVDGISLTVWRKVKKSLEEF